MNTPLLCSQYRLISHQVQDSSQLLSTSTASPPQSRPARILLPPVRSSSVLCQGRTDQRMTREVSTRIPAVRPSERLDSTVPPLTSLVRTPLVVRIRIIIPAIIVVLWDRRALDDVGQWTFDSIHRSRDWLRGPTDQNNLGFNNWDSIGNLTRLGWVGQDRAGPSKVYFLFIFKLAREF